MSSSLAPKTRTRPERRARGNLSLTTTDRLYDSRLTAPAQPSTLADAFGPTVEWRPVDVPVPNVGQEIIPRRRNEIATRAINIVLAGVGMVVIAPVFAVLAAAIKLDSRGPVLYSQSRVGIDRRWRRMSSTHEARREDAGGRVFTIYKLRTMHVDAESTPDQVWATEGDPRVTRVGRVLRRFRIDEIPQLWNILRGDMNIVGPRPEQPTIAMRLRDDIPEYRLRHRVKPGLTGLAQINQSYDTTLDSVRSKVAWDLRYIREQSLLLDLRVMLLTIPAVLLKFRGW